MGENPPPLGVELRWMRQAAGLSGPGLASMLGISQASVSRFEGGSRQPGPELVDRWRDLCEQHARERLADDSQPVRAYRELSEAVDRMATAAYRQTLINLINDANSEVVSNLLVYRTGMAERQQQLIELDRRATRIRHFQPLIVPGPLQTPEYGRLVFLGYGGNEAESIRAAERRQERSLLLRQPGGPKYHAIITEGIFDVVLAGANPSLRTEVLHNILDAIRYDHITVQVILRNTPWAHVPMGAFLMYDVDLHEGRQSLVLVETYSAQIKFVGPRDLEQHDARWQQLVASALNPTDSAAWLRTAVDK